MRDFMPGSHPGVERKASALAPHRERMSEEPSLVKEERIEGGNILEVAEKPLPFEIVPAQYHQILRIIQNIFDTDGVRAWAVSGSMARHIHGYASSQPKDVDGFTTAAGLEALVSGLRENENRKLFDELGLKVEVEDLDSEDYGKCKRVHIYSANQEIPKEESVDIEFFGEGHVEGYGGTSGLDNPAVENKIIRSEVGEPGAENTFTIQYFSKEVLARWYTLVYGREMANFAKKLFEPDNNNHDKLKVKIANRFVALLTLFGERYGSWPEEWDKQSEYLIDAFGGILRHIQDLKKYKNLPAESMGIVVNMESYVRMVVNELEIEKKSGKSEPVKKTEYGGGDRARQLLKNISDMAGRNKDIDIAQIDKDITKINLEELSFEELQQFYDSLTVISLAVSQNGDSLKLVEFIGILEDLRDNNSPLRNLFIKVPLISHLKAVIAGRNNMNKISSGINVERIGEALEDSGVAVEVVKQLEKGEAFD